MSVYNFSYGLSPDLSKYPVTAGIQASFTAVNHL
jgi:hypothetical protein